MLTATYVIGEPRVGGRIGGTPAVAVRVEAGRGLCAVTVLLNDHHLTRPCRPSAGLLGLESDLGASEYVPAGSRETLYLYGEPSPLDVLRQWRPDLERRLCDTWREVSEAAPYWDGRAYRAA